MKKFCDIPECVELFNKMFAEWDKIPRREGGKDLLHERKRKEVEKVYLPQIFAAYDKYKEQHPEEFQDEDKDE